VRSFAERMASYAAYHRDPRTRLTHFVGVPAIVLAVLVLLALARVPIGSAEVSLAVVLVAVMLGWYLTLDLAVGLALVVLTAPLLWAAELVARQSLPVGLGVFLALFVGGWVVQLVGHRIEGNRPALLDNLSHTLVAPAFLAAELLFALGLRPGLREEVERRVREDDPRQG
jgi:uncharacterized membrane protein YGL010W